MNQLCSTFRKELTDESNGIARARRMFEFMKVHGSAHYDEVVTQLEHALQCADLAVQANASDETVVSALLHDFGHFLQSEHVATGEYLQADLKHEDIAAEFLRGVLPAEVISPIQHHVTAKRYLCTVDENYHNELSPASQHSLRLQGGKLSDAEVAEFRRQPNLVAILQVRRWDDMAKQAVCDCPRLEEYVQRLASVWL